MDILLSDTLKYLHFHDLKITKFSAPREVKHLHIKAVPASCYKILIVHLRI